MTLATFQRQLERLSQQTVLAAHELIAVEQRFRDEIPRMVTIFRKLHRSEEAQPTAEEMAHIDYFQYLGARLDRTLGYEEVVPEWMTTRGCTEPLYCIDVAFDGGVVDGIPMIVGKGEPLRHHAHRNALGDPNAIPPAGRGFPKHCPHCKIFNELVASAVSHTA